jgi:hypothetical protein
LIFLLQSSWANLPYRLLTFHILNLISVFHSLGHSSSVQVMLTMMRILNYSLFSYPYENCSREEEIFPHSHYSSDLEFSFFSHFWILQVFNIRILPPTNCINSHNSTVELYSHIWTLTEAQHILFKIWFGINLLLCVDLLNCLLP